MTGRSPSASNTATAWWLPNPVPALLSEAVAAIEDGNRGAAVIHLEALKRLTPDNFKFYGDAHQRVAAVMVDALSSRISAFSPLQHLVDLYGVEQREGSQLLHDISPCFRVALHAASVAIVEAVGDHPGAIRLFDFNVSFTQHAALIQYLADQRGQSRSLNVTTFTNPSSPFEQPQTASLLTIGERVKELAEQAGVKYSFEVASCRAVGLSCRLCWEPGEAVAVNLAFALSDTPDESVSTAYHGDSLLDCVRRLGPQVVTLVEQELNTSTAPLSTRFTEACAHYGAIRESLDATWEWGKEERARAEAALSKKAANAVVWDAPDRPERCEVFGKWLARFGKAGFRQVSLGSGIAEQLVEARVGPVPTGFTVKAEDGVLRFCWRGRVVTVASAWRPPPPPPPPPVT